MESKRVKGQWSRGEQLVSRRRFLGLSGAALAGVGLLGSAACGEDGGRQGGEVVNLTVAIGPDPTGTFATVIERFNQEYEGRIRAQVREMPADQTQHINQLRSEFQAGGGSIDVMQGASVNWPPELAANGWVEDLGDRFTENMRREFIPITVEAYTYEGKNYGVPFWNDAGLLYYRKDLLEGSGFSDPPRTWDELKEQTQKVASESGIEKGFVFQGARYEGGVVNALEYIWSAGGDLVDDPTNPERIVIDSPQAVTGLQVMRSLITDGVTPEAVVSYKEQESHNVFLQGDAVFLRNWPYVYGVLSDPDASRIEPEQVGITQLPTASVTNESANCLGGWGLLMNEASEKKEAAWEFITFITAPAQQKTRAVEGSYLPTREDLYEDKEIVDSVPVIELAGGQAFKNSRIRPLSVYYQDMSLIMQEQFNNVLTGRVPPEGAVRTLQEELAPILEREANL